MNWVDLILLLILLLSIINSVQRGFILAALDLICWAGSLTLAFLLYNPISNFLDRDVFDLGPWSAPLCFLVILIGARIIFDALSIRVLERVSEKTNDHTINKLFGIFPGIVNGFLWVMVTASLLSVFPIMTSMSESGRDSKLGSWTVAKAAWFHEKISPVFAALFEKMSEGSNAAVGEDESVELPFKVNNPKRRADLEAEMLELVNTERRDNGLKPVQADPAIAEVAVKHSADMFARGYFSHLNPDGKTPFQRIRAEGVNFFTAGENLALAQTLDIAHRGLMNSPGHRANILRPAFGRLGIGILDGGIYGLMITQNFRN